MQLIPLELVKSNRDSVRKAREAYLIKRGQSLEPQSVNKKHEKYNVNSSDKHVELANFDYDLMFRIYSTYNFKSNH